MRSFRARRLAVFLLAISAFALATACASSRVRRETVRFVKEDEAVFTRPVVTVVGAPTGTDPVLRLRLTRKVLAPLYEVDVTEEQARALELRNVFVIALAAISGGGITLGTREGTTIVRSQPRKVKDLEEIEQPWTAGIARIEIAGAAATEIQADRDGGIRVRVPDLLLGLPAEPTTALRLAISAAIGRERDAKVVEIPLDTLRRWSAPRR